MIFKYLLPLLFILSFLFRINSFPFSDFTIFSKRKVFYPGLKYYRVAVKDKKNGKFIFISDDQKFKTHYGVKRILKGKLPQKELRSFLLKRNSEFYRIEKTIFFLIETEVNKKKNQFHIENRILLEFKDGGSNV